MKKLFNKEFSISRLHKDIRARDVRLILISSAATLILLFFLSEFKTYLISGANRSEVIDALSVLLYGSALFFTIYQWRKDKRMRGYQILKKDLNYLLGELKMMGERSNSGMIFSILEFERIKRLIGLYQGAQAETIVEILRSSTQLVELYLYEVDTSQAEIEAKKNILLELNIYLSQYHIFCKHYLEKEKNENLSREYIQPIDSHKLFNLKYYEIWLFMQRKYNLNDNFD